MQKPETFRRARAALAGGDFDSAEALFASLLSNQPDHLQARIGLINALMSLRRNREALAHFDRALEKLPGHPPLVNGKAVALNRLAVEALKDNQAAQARALLEQALALQPGMADARFNLALSLIQESDFDAAEAQLNRIGAPGSAPHLVLQHARIALARGGPFDQVIGWLEPLAADPDHGEEARRLLIEILVRRGERAKARRHCRGLPLAQVLKAHLEVPPVAPSADAIDRDREDVAHWSQRILEGPPVGISRLEEVGWNNFYLAYHGQCNRDLRSLWGQIVGREVARLCPELMEPPRPQGRRVGFLSSRWGDNVIGHYFGGWISAFRRAGWQTHVYLARPRSIDPVTEKLLELAHVGRTLRGSSREMADTIRSDGLEAIVIPEVGADETLTPLAAARLAPLQLAGWGLPDTTGLDTFDGFISVDAMEPENAETHYSESLIRLPRLGVAYPGPPKPIAASRDELGLPASGRLYLAPHSHCKFHPDFDPVLAGILSRDPSATLVLFSGGEAQHWRDLERRLERAFEPLGIRLPDRVILLPPMERRRYLAVCRQCDVQLDTLHFSGGNTTLDALSVGLPVVTLPGALMRGRQTAAMLAQAGLGQWVARSPSHYVDLALEVARDGCDRQKIVSAAALLFGDERPLEALVAAVEARVG